MSEPSVVTRARWAIGSVLLRLLEREGLTVTAGAPQEAERLLREYRTFHDDSHGCHIESVGGPDWRCATCRAVDRWLASSNGRTEREPAAVTRDGAQTFVFDPWMDTAANPADFL